mmetsp:Transcript_15524/g.54173  ORF Transcript_15524/g.54173 Transcript_15524/m.54173 type:complete len:385 (+) Transcript_15524:467-1621(+)
MKASRPCAPASATAGHGCDRHSTAISQRPRARCDGAGPPSSFRSAPPASSKSTQVHSASAFKSCTGRSTRCLSAGAKAARAAIKCANSSISTWSSLSKDARAHSHRATPALEAVSRLEASAASMPPTAASMAKRRRGCSACNSFRPIPAAFAHLPKHSNAEAHPFWTTASSSICAAIRRARAADGRRATSSGLRRKGVPAAGTRSEYRLRGGIRVDSKVAHAHRAASSSATAQRADNLSGPRAAKSADERKASSAPRSTTREIAATVKRSAAGANATVEASLRRACDVCAAAFGTRSAASETTPAHSTATAIPAGAMPISPESMASHVSAAPCEPHASINCRFAAEISAPGDAGSCNTRHASMMLRARDAFIAQSVTGACPRPK